MSIRNSSKRIHGRDKISIALVCFAVGLYYVEEFVIGSEHSREGPAIFLWAERCFALFFTYEYIVRWREHGWKWSYLVSPVALIDLISILPFWVGFFVAESQLDIIRTLRLLRLLKLVPFMPGVQLLVTALARAWPQVRTILVVQVFMTMFATAAIYECERHEEGTAFTSLGESIWFTAVTVTTVGYGDVTPVTPLGRAIAMLTFFTGVVLFGAFAGMIGGAVSDVIQESNETDEEPIGGVKAKSIKSPK